MLEKPILTTHMPLKSFLQWLTFYFFLALCLAVEPLVLFSNRESQESLLLIACYIVSASTAFGLVGLLVAGILKTARPYLVATLIISSVLLSPGNGARSNRNRWAIESANGSSNRHNHCPSSAIDNYWCRWSCEYWTSIGSRQSNFSILFGIQGKDYLKRSSNPG